MAMQIGIHNRSYRPRRIMLDEFGDEQFKSVAASSARIDSADSDREVSAVGFDQRFEDIRQPVNHTKPATKKPGGVRR